MHAKWSWFYFCFIAMDVTREFHICLYVCVHVCMPAQIYICQSCLLTALIVNFYGVFIFVLRFLSASSFNEKQKAKTTARGRTLQLTTLVSIICWYAFSTMQYLVKCLRNMKLTVNNKTRNKWATNKWSEWFFLPTHRKRYLLQFAFPPKCQPIIP